MYAPSLAALQKTLANKGIIAEIQPATKTKKQKLIDYLDTILSDNGDYTTEQIAEAVLKEAKVNPHQYVDHILINKKDKHSSIVVVDVLEYSLTAKKVCELAGL